MQEDYQDMLIFMYDNSTINEATKKNIIDNIINVVNNKSLYTKDAKEKLKEMLNKYKASPKGSKRQKATLAKILDSKMDYFNDTTRLLKRKEDTHALPHVEEEEEPELADHYYRNQISKDIESLSDLIVIDSNHIDALQLFYRIADDPEKYSVFDKRDTNMITSLVESLTKNIDSRKKAAISDNITKLMQFENQRRQTNIETIRRITENNLEGDQLIDSFKKASTIDANQLNRFGLINEDFTIDDVYKYYNCSINPKNDSDIRVRNLVLQLHDAIRKTNIFDQSAKPTNMKQLKSLIKYIKVNGDRDVFYNMNSDSSDEINDANLEADNKYLSNNKTMSKSVFHTPTKEYLRRNKRYANKDDTDKNDYTPLLDNNVELKKGSDINEAELLANYMNSAPSGKRTNKTVDALQKRMNDLYIFDNKQSVDISKYRSALFDILINGNYRIKFSPKCATRDGAEAYCKKRFDKNGYLLYRLIPARRDTKDPLGNSICDLNGDRVEDIVIVDTRGKPVIINGFRLIKADPYKKLWQTERIKKGGERVL
ncbi:hypothetical protein M9Y10_004671 [Tritrichomonas musculus]|uniref:Uncharacterized protein n=1 Tax=Tritrichomonas musculus TaxID=1915356 RepID=A0ABR2JK33_9EUKA